MVWAKLASPLFHLYTNPPTETKLKKYIYIVDSWGVLQLGGPDPWYNRVGPAKVGAHNEFLFTESFLEVKIKNTWLILKSVKIKIIQVFNIFKTRELSVKKRLTCHNLFGTNPGEPCTRPLAVQHLDNWLFINHSPITKQT